MTTTLEPWNIRYVEKKRPDNRDYESRVSMSCFATMVVTILNGNEKWDLDEIVDDWWDSVPFERRDDWEVYHELVFLKAELFFSGCQKNNNLMPKNFVSLYQRIKQDDFNELSLEEVDKLDTEISTHTGYKFKLLMEEST